MQAKRKTAPEQSATQYLSGLRSGARWCERADQPAGRGTSRTDFQQIARSMRRLSCRPERLRQQILARNPGKISNLREVLYRHGLPLTDGARTLSDAASKATETTTFSFEICDELFHAHKLSGTEISVKLIYSARLHRTGACFGGVCRP